MKCLENAHCLGFHFVFAKQHNITIQAKSKANLALTLKTVQWTLLRAADPSPSIIFSHNHGPLSFKLYSIH